MKIAEIIVKKLTIPVQLSNDEHSLLEQLKKSETTQKSELSENQVVIANELVKKSVIQRVIEHGKVVYKTK